MKFKQLEWNYNGSGSYIAFTPSTLSGYLVISFEEDKYWAVWDPSLKGTTDLISLKDAAQKFHEKYLMQFMTEV